MGFLCFAPLTFQSWVYQLWVLIRNRFLDLSWHEELGMKCVHINNVKRTQKLRIISHDSLITFSLIACFFMKEHKEWFIKTRNCKYFTRTSWRRNENCGYCSKSSIGIASVMIFTFHEPKCERSKHTIRTKLFPVPYFRHNKKYEYARYVRPRLWVRLWVIFMQSLGEIWPNNRLVYTCTLGVGT